MNVEALRRQIPVTQQMVYMNTGWSGPSPLPVVQRIREVLEEELHQGPATPDAIQRSQRIADDARRAVARLLRVAPEEIALTQNTTEGLNIAAHGLEWRPGDSVVTCSLEHPSVLGLCYSLAQGAGARPQVIQIDPQEDRETILARFDLAITPGTRLVALSHIQYSCGLRLPVEEIGRLAHDRGALLLLDGAQAAGQLVLDMEALGCDFYALPGQKWLLGPDGTGALYIRKELVEELRPFRGSYFGVATWDAQGNIEPQKEGVARFGTGTSSSALLAGFATAIGFVEGAGWEEVEARSRHLAMRMKAGLVEVPGVTLTGPLEDESLFSGLVTFALEGHEPAKVVERLWGEHRVAGRSVRHPPGVRLCTAFFNTEEEVERVVGAVRDITAVT